MAGSAGNGPDLPVASGGQHAPPKVSIVIPCFNEAEGIGQTVAALLGYLRECQADCSFELILVDDGSSDGSGEILSAAAGENANVHAVHFPHNRGRGAALRAGIGATKGDYVISLDADRSYDEEHIGRILKCFETAPRVDVVVVSAYMPGGSVTGVPWDRLLISRLANWLLARLCAAKLSTLTCVVRGYRGDLIRSLPLSEDGKAIHLEILMELLRRRAALVEIPGHLEWKRGPDREAPPSKSGFVRSVCRHLRYALRS